jgi:TctA family transporter
MLMGLLPIYVAGALGLLVFRVPQEKVEIAFYFGLTLPFVAGLWGIRSVYLGFMQLADTLPPERRCRRECFLRRLTLACAACYTAVTPVMIYTLWDNFANKLA